MEANVSQHHAFLSGLEELERYAKETKVEDYDSSKVVGIIDGFGQIFSEHLADEIETLLKLDVYDAKKLKDIYDIFELELRKGDKVCFPTRFDEKLSANFNIGCFVSDGDGLGR